MKIEVRREIDKLLREIEKYEDVLDVLTNYDSMAVLTVGSHHNGNTKRYKSVSIDVPSNISISSIARNKLFVAKTKLDNLLLAYAKGETYDTTKMSYLDYGEQPYIVTLCGSVRFEEDFRRVQSELALAGNLVFSLDTFSDKNKDDVDPDFLRLCAVIHRRKIDMSNGIYVINKDGYIGESTKSEIEYAESLRKSVKYMEPIN